jgi:predicted dehydrogenase
MIKLKELIDSGFLGRILSVRGEFGYWVFTGGELLEGGDSSLPQRPSWNYKGEDGGGIILDMLCHWRYLLDNLFGGVQSVSCLGARHIPFRWDESGARYAATADDACYSVFELQGGVIAQFNSSWCTRVRRDDLLTLHVDGTSGSAVAGLRDCRIQPLGATPRPVWNPDEPASVNYMAGWELVPDTIPYENAFLAQWELFLRHIVAGAPFRWNLLEGAKGVQLAEGGIESWKTRKWVDIPNLENYNVRR